MFAGDANNYAHHSTSLSANASGPLDVADHRSPLGDASTLYSLYNRLLALASRRAMATHPRLRHNPSDSGNSFVSDHRSVVTSPAPSAAASGISGSGFSTGYKLDTLSPSSSPLSSASSPSPSGRDRPARFHPYYLSPAVPSAASLSSAAMYVARRRLAAKSMLSQ